MYLDASDVDGAFASVLRCGGAESRIFTFMEIPVRRPTGLPPAGGLSDIWLAWKRSRSSGGCGLRICPPFSWSEDSDFRSPSPADLRRRYLPGVDGSVDLAEGERIGLAARA
jgi:hypothetical protein